MKNKFKYMWMTAVWVSVCPAAWAVMPSDSVQVQSVDSIKMKYYVKGCVTDAVSGEPLLGVSVASMPGISALTDEKGYYRVPVASYDGQLTFSSPGYVPRTVSLRGQRSKDMVMYTEAFRSEKSGDDVWGCSTSFSVDEEIGMRFGGDIRAVSRGDLPGLSQYVHSGLSFRKFEFSAFGGHRRCHSKYGECGVCLFRILYQCFGQYRYK